MAYGTKWDWNHPIESVADAYKRSCRLWKNPPDVLYRFEAVSYSYIIDAEREDYGSTEPVLELDTYEVLRWAPTGATLRLMSGARNRHVNFSHTKQFACRTPAQALESFIQRRRSQIRRLTNQLARAEYELALTVPFHERSFPLCPA